MTSEKSTFLILATEQAQHFKTMETLLARVDQLTQPEEKLVEDALFHLIRIGQETTRTIQQI